MYYRLFSDTFFYLNTEHLQSKQKFVDFIRKKYNIIISPSFFVLNYSITRICNNDKNSEKYFVEPEILDKFTPSKDTSLCINYNLDFMFPHVRDIGKNFAIGYITTIMRLKHVLNILAHDYVGFDDSNEDESKNLVQKNTFITSIYAALDHTTFYNFLIQCSLEQNFEVDYFGFDMRKADIGEVKFLNIFKKISKKNLELSLQTGAEKKPAFFRLFYKPMFKNSSVRVFINSRTQQHNNEADVELFNYMDQLFFSPKSDVVNNHLISYYFLFFLHNIPSDILSTQMPTTVAELSDIEKKLLLSCGLHDQTFAQISVSSSVKIYFTQKLKKLNSRFDVFLLYMKINRLLSQKFPENFLQFEKSNLITTSFGKTDTVITVKWPILNTIKDYENNLFEDRARDNSLNSNNLEKEILLTKKVVDSINRDLKEYFVDSNESELFNSKRLKSVR